MRRDPNIFLDPTVQLPALSSKGTESNAPQKDYLAGLKELFDQYVGGDDVADFAVSAGRQLAKSGMSNPGAALAAGAKGAGAGIVGEAVVGESFNALVGEPQNEYQAGLRRLANRMGGSALAGYLYGNVPGAIAGAAGAAAYDIGENVVTGAMMVPEALSLGYEMFIESPRRESEMEKRLQKTMERLATMDFQSRRA